MWRYAFPGLVLLLAGPAIPQDETPILADYIENRDNRVYGCYCEWSSENEVGGREVTLAWALRSGSFEGTPLTGVKVAAVIKGEDSLSQWNPRRKSVLIIDETASGAQQKAVETMLRNWYGDLIGEVLAVYQMPIELTRTADEATFTAGHVMTVSMRRARPAEDAMQGALLWFEPFIKMKESTMGTTIHTRFSGDDFNLKWDWRNPGITGYYGTAILTAP